MPENDTRTCPYCKEPIAQDAKKCKHCGEILDETLKEVRSLQTQQINTTNTTRKWSPGIAALLSFIIPGAGQMYKGKVGAGIVWLIFTAIAYCLFVIPGIIVHIICIVNATKGNPYADDNFDMG